MTDGALPSPARQPGLAATAAIGVVTAYQHTLSPILPALLGPNAGCRFYPSCSHYAIDAFRAHGALRGSVLAARRVIRCTPLNPGGIDPVPPV